MSLSGTITTFEADVAIAHNIIHGAATATVNTEGGEVKTFANAIASLSQYTLKGAWLTATNYTVLDLVTSGAYIYLCIVDHLSGTFATDLAAGKWIVYQNATVPGIRTIAASGSQQASDTTVSIDATSGDVTFTFLSANDPVAKEITLHREDATANAVNFTALTGTVARATTWTNALTTQDDVMTFRPNATTNNWIRV